MLRRYSPLLLIFILFIAFSLVSLKWGPLGSSDPIRDHSITRANPWGWKALAELCRHFQLPVEAFAAPLDQLSSQQRFLCIVDPGRMLREEEKKKLVSWILEGGVLLLALDLNPAHAYPLETNEPSFKPSRSASSPALPPLLSAPDVALLEMFGLKGNRAPLSSSFIRSQAAYPELQDIHHIFIPGPHRLHLMSFSLSEKHSLLRPRASWQTLIADRFGAVLLKAQIGAGIVYVLSEAEIFSNAFLSKADNVVLAANLFFSDRHQQIFVAESLHPLLQMKQAAASELPLARFRLAFGLATGALAIYLLGVSFRFGRPHPLSIQPRRSALEFVEALADVYWRAGAREAIWDMLRQSFRRQLATRAGLPAEASAEALAEGVARRAHISAAALRQMLAQLDDTPPHISDRGLLAIAQKIAGVEETILE